MFGDGLLAFRDQAVSVMDPDELLKLFQHLLDEHPDIWQPWSVAVQQLCMVGRVEEARELAKEATGHFPLLGRLWVDLADVDYFFPHRLKGFRVASPIDGSGTSCWRAKPATGAPRGSLTSCPSYLILNGSVL